MTNPTAAVRRLAAVPAALLAALALAGPATGSAQTGAFHFQEPFSDPIPGFPCFEGVPGTLTGVETVDGHFTENGPPSLGFHAHGSSAQTYRVDFTDGRYVLGTSSSRFNFNATVRGHITDTSGGRDSATAYAADGQPIGPLTIHAVYHVSYVDADRDNQPDPGEFTAHVDRLSARCP